MNVPLYRTIIISLCMTSPALPIFQGSSGLPSGSSNDSQDRNSHSQQRTMKIICSDSRGRRHSLPLVGVDNVDLHRIATCTKVPGRLVCKSGRYNYVINNGNFEIPAETLEKLVSALYQKAKDKESDFAVSLVAPEKTPASSVTEARLMPTMRMDVTESSDQLQPVTIECELTDAKTLKETNPDYHPKPNERLFKCITKRLGFKRKRDPLHVSISQDQTVNIIGTKETASLSVEGTKRKRSSSLLNFWKIYKPFWKKNDYHGIQIRSLSFSATRRFRDVVKKTGFDASMFDKPDIEDEGGAKYQPEVPRPRVRDYNHTCLDPQHAGWCPPLLSTPYQGRQCTSSTIHPTYYTENPNGSGFQRPLQKRLIYKFRNPFLEFFMPIGLKSWMKSEGKTDDVQPSAKHEHDHNYEDENDPGMTESNRAATIPYRLPDFETTTREIEDYYADDDPKRHRHRKPGPMIQHSHHRDKASEHNLERNREFVLRPKQEVVQVKNRCEACWPVGPCFCQKSKRKKSKPCCSLCCITCRPTKCTVIKQKICIGLRRKRTASQPSDDFRTRLKSKRHLDRPL